MATRILSRGECAHAIGLLAKSTPYPSSADRAGVVAKVVANQSRIPKRNAAAASPNLGQIRRGTGPERSRTAHIRLWVVGH
jgi:hypothetical protein